MSIFPNASAPVELEITQFADHVNMRYVSQLVKVFNIFGVTSSGSFPVILDLNLDDSESVMLSFGPYMWCCHKLPHVFA